MSKTEPKAELRQIRRTGWSCLIDKHFHLDRDVAQRCIDKQLLLRARAQKKREGKLTLTFEASSWQESELLRLGLGEWILAMHYQRAPKLTLQKIGERLGVQRERVRQREGAHLRQLRRLLPGLRALVPVLSAIASDQPSHWHCRALEPLDQESYPRPLPRRYQTVTHAHPANEPTQIVCVGGPLDGQTLTHVHPATIIGHFSNGTTFGYRFCGTLRKDDVPIYEPFDFALEPA